MYADYTTLLTTANAFDKIADLSISIKNELVKINEWLQVNELSLRAEERLSLLSKVTLLH